MWDKLPLCRDREASITTTASLNYFTTPVSIATTASLNYLSKVTRGNSDHGVIPIMSSNNASP